jgi:hypothetical protein
MDIVQNCDRYNRIRDRSNMLVNQGNVTINIPSNTVTRVPDYHSDAAADNSYDE